MKPNLIKIEKLVTSKKAIITNNKFIKRTLGFEDMREFTEAIHSWGYSRDFTYQSNVYGNWQKFLKQWLFETYL